MSRLVGDRGKCYLFQTVWRLTTTINRLRTTTTDTWRPITRPVTVQPDLSQGYNYTDFDETSATSLRLAWQPTRRDWLPEHRCLVKTTTMRTLSDETLTVTLTPKLRPTSTLTLLRQRLYRTSEATLKLSHVYYTLQPITTFNYDFLQKSRAKTNRK